VTTGTMLGRAVAIAAEVHMAQRDMGGNAYILHPLRVMMRLRTTDEDLMCIAVLHDSVEDSNGAVTLDGLRAEGFSERVVNALALLTHDKDEPYDIYVRKIATSRDAILVKLGDLGDNGDIHRLKGLRPKDFERMQKYHRAFIFLTTTLTNMEKVGY
jgi:(p)ppGpp synthase/HD superfamily hydrolase